MSQRDPFALAKVGYAAYGAVTGFKNYAGLPMPEWEALPPKVKEAWDAAAQAIFCEGTPLSDPAELNAQLDALEVFEEDHEHFDDICQ